MISWEASQKMVADAVEQFPTAFGLRAFPGDTFRVSLRDSYVNDSGVVMVYTEVKRGERWLSFAKGTVSELKREIV